jgi:hypothetical protein
VIYILREEGQLSGPAQLISLISVLSAQFAQLAQFPMGFSRPGGSRDLHLRGTVLHPLFHDVLVSKPSALWLGTISALQPEAEEFVTVCYKRVTSTSELLALLTLIPLKAYNLTIL